MQILTLKLQYNLGDQTAITPVTTSVTSMDFVVPGSELDRKPSLKIREDPLPRPKRFWLAPVAKPLMTSLTHLALWKSRNFDLEQTDRHLKRVLAIGSRMYGEEHPALVAPLMMAGDNARSMGKLDEAEQIYSRMHEMASRLYGPKHYAVSSSLHGLAEVNEMRGEYGKAEMNYLMASDVLDELRKKVVPTNEEEKAIVKELHDNYYDIRAGLGVMYDLWKKYDKAQQVNREVFFWRPDVRRPDHPFYASYLHPSKSLLNVPMIDRPDIKTQEEEMRVRQKEAESLMTATSYLTRYGKVLDLQTRNLGEFHRGVAGALHLMAHVHTEIGDVVSAEKVLKRLLSIRLREQGPESVATAGVYALMGNWHMRKQEWNEAMRLYDKAIEIKKAVLGKTDLQVGLLHLSKVGALQNAGSLTGSLKSMTKAWANICLSMPTLAPDSPKEIEDTIRSHSWVRLVDHARLYYTRGNEEALMGMIKAFTAGELVGGAEAMPEEMRKIFDEGAGAALVEYARKRDKMMKEKGVGSIGKGGEGGGRGLVNEKAGSGSTSAGQLTNDEHGSPATP
jgi:tetratricopeptide (TPR) repeat protein